MIFLSLMILSATPSTLFSAKLSSAQNDFALGRFDEAAATAAEAVALDSKNCDAKIVLGQSLLRSSRMEEARQAFEQARQLRCKNRPLYEELSSIYDVTQQYEQAIRVYDDFIKISPKDPRMLNEKGLTLLLLKRFEEAVQTLSILESVQPQDIQTKLDLGCALLRAKRYKEAIQRLSVVLKDNPKQTEALQYMAQAQAGIGDAAGAAITLDQLIDLSPKDTLVRAMRGRLRMLTQNPEGALADYQILNTEKPGDATALLGSAAAYIALGKLEEAQEVIKQARTVLGDHLLVTVREIEISWLRHEPKSEEKLVSAISKINNSKEIWIELEQGATKLGYEEKSRFARARAAQ